KKSSGKTWSSFWDSKRCPRSVSTAVRRGSCMIGSAAMIKNPVPWPNGARCAVAFTFDMDADSILHLAHHTSADTRLAAMSMLRYGPEIAAPRLVELYERFDMHQNTFLPAQCLARYARD